MGHANLWIVPILVQCCQSEHKPASAFSWAVREGLSEYVAFKSRVT